MNKIVINAMAKINLGLDVLRRRENGYHDVKMIMQTVNIYDTLEFVKVSEFEIFLCKNIKARTSGNKRYLYLAK